MIVQVPSTQLNDGTQLPAIGFGVYLIPLSKTAEVVKQALEVGYRLIDCASCYSNEAQCGEGILEFLEEHPEVMRSDIVYTSKIWETDFGYESAQQSIQNSLDKVKGLKYIDLYLMHSSAGGKELRLQTYKALQEAVKLGELRSIGVSNWGVKHLKELLEWPGLEVKPAVNQIELSPWMQHQDIVDFCTNNGIKVEAFSPLTIGQKLEDEQLLSLARKYKKTPAQIMLRWSIQHGATPLPKTCRLDRMKENINVFDFVLTEEDYRSLGDPNAYHITLGGWDPTKWD